MLTNKLADSRIKQEQRKNYLQYLVSNRVEKFESTYFVTWPLLKELKQYLQNEIRYAPRSWNDHDLQDGIDRFIYHFIELHDIKPLVR